MPTKQKSTILVVDDDNTHRTMLLTLLAGWGYEPSGAADGGEAISLCQSTAYDLVLMDVRMPGITGLEALQAIKAHNPTLPILMMTAYSEVESAVQAIKAGAHDYITKPLDFERLKINLRNLLEISTLHRENSRLKGSAAPVLDGVIGSSKAMHKLTDMVKTVAASDATVLINGESGTGKELIAKALHRHSPRSAGPYVAFNCAALAESLIESELFGHEKGAFTGADKTRMGKFAAASGGTLFLDEVGEMPLGMQAKLLRVIQEREVEPLGSNKTIPVDTRLIAATNRNLEAEVATGNFREDLYYRLNVVQLAVPPLRDRKEDIPALVQHFVDIFAVKNRKKVSGLTPAAMELLQAYPWPGNVRELENAIERTVILLIGEQITERELPPQIVSTMQHHAGQQHASYTSSATQELKSKDTLKDMEKSRILAALAECGGNKSETAKRLGISRKTLHSKLQKYEEEV